MERFHIIEEAIAIICSKDVYKQTKVFRKGTDIYAAYANGFIKLYNASCTSAPKVSWHEIEGPGIIIEKYKQPKWDINYGK